MVLVGVGTAGTEVEELSTLVRLLLKNAMPEEEAFKTAEVFAANPEAMHRAYAEVKPLLDDDLHKSKHEKFPPVKYYNMILEIAKEI